MRDKPPRVVPLTRRFRTKVHCQDLDTIFSLNVFTLATIMSTAPLLAFLTGCLLLTVRSNNCNYHVVNCVVINSHRSPLFNSVVNMTLDDGRTLRASRSPHLYLLYECLVRYHRSVETRGPHFLVRLSGMKKSACSPVSAGSQRLIRTNRVNRLHNEFNEFDRFDRFDGCAGTNQQVGLVGLVLPRILDRLFEDHARLKPNCTSTFLFYARLIVFLMDALLRPAYSS